MADLGIDGDMVSAKGAVSGVESISLNGAKGGEWGADHSGSNILGVAWATEPPVVVRSSTIKTFLPWIS